IWPALWLMPTKEKYGGWAASGEIDMVEYLGHEPKTIYGTLHYGGKWPNNVSKGKSYTLRNGTFADDFHLFVFEWEYGQTRWYVDGLLYHQDSNWWSSGGPFPAPFDQDFHMLLNVAVGGNWPGYPDGTTQFPQQMIVDYIRVYQKNVSVDDKTDDLPASMHLLSAHPNPFNAVAILSYQVQKQGRVQLYVMNVRGQLIETLVNNVCNPGLYTFSYDASSLPAGIFLLCLNAEGQRDQIRLVSVK
ncbi:MAG: glycosyl hydrolase family protein, partial [Calditrichaeota bacterium]